MMEKYIYYNKTVIATLNKHGFHVDENAAYDAGIPPSWVPHIQRLLLNSLPEGVRYDSLVVAVNRNGTRPSSSIQLIPYVDELPALFSVGNDSNTTPEEDIRTYTPLPDKLAYDMPVESRIPQEFFNPASQLRLSVFPSFSGVQDKFVANAVVDGERVLLSLPQPDGRGNVIVKPTNHKYPTITRNEWVCMNLAKCAGFETPRTFLFHQNLNSPILNEINTHLFVERFDMQTADYKPQKRPISEMAALMGLSSKTKYSLSTEDMFYMAQSLLSAEDMSKLSLMYFFGVCIGNNDMHTKNFSLFVDPITQEHSLAPVYDMVSIHGLTDDFPDRLGLTLNDTRDPQFKDIVDFLKLFTKLEQMKTVAESIKENIEPLVAYAYDGDSFLLNNTRERLLFEIDNNTDRLLIEIRRALRG